jgi:PAS domain S-box-containing protein
MTAAMEKVRLRPSRRLVVMIMLPVMAAGLLVAFIANHLLAEPLLDHLKTRADLRLRLASSLALEICDDMMQDILSLRLEDDPASTASMQKEAMAQMNALHQRLVNVHLAVVDEKGEVLFASLLLAERLAPPRLAAMSDEIRIENTPGGPARVHCRYFPLWRWHVLALATEETYLGPALLASRTVYLATFGVVLAVLVTVLLVFHLLLGRPLHRMLEATRQVSAGGFPRLEAERADELGQLSTAFNTMVHSLEQGQKRVEQAVAQLRLSEEAYRALAENSLALITIVSQGQVVYANRRTQTLSGYTQDELLGRPLLELIHHDDREAVARRAQSHEAGDWRDNLYEFRYLCKDGRVRWLELLASPTVHLGKPAVLGHGIDITERKLAQHEQAQLEAKLQHAQRMEVVGTLAGGISHDFNNLLQAIGGYSQILLGRLGEDSPHAPHLRSIQKASERGGDLINHLLAFSRRAESRLKPVNLNQEVLQVCHMLARTIPRMVSIETRLAHDIWPVLADPTQLEQVVMNLGSNAKDAMPQGGRLTLETANVHLDEKYCQGLGDVTPGDYVQLKVADTGHGMDEQTLRHIFDPFFTTKPLGQGTGLGLSTVYGIVKAHRGHISCYSRTGQGTTFNLYLPVSAEPALEQAQPSPPPPPPSRGREAILLVDDEAALLEIGKEMLGELGYDVLTAASGEEALETFNARAGRVNLVLMDLGMPGMGGLAAMARMLAQDAGAKVIISTGYVGKGQEEEARQAGAAGFLAKPYQLRDLAAKIREVLDTGICRPD